MNSIVVSNLKALMQTESLLSKLSDEQLSNTNVEPYNSSIGSHIRHILDFYDCIFNCEKAQIDLTDRKRNSALESSSENLSNYLNSVVKKLKELDLNDNNMLTVIDDHGLGKVEIKYTSSSLLAQANSHTIHHYAIINYILSRLNISLVDNSFGYNPTTPIKIIS